jgi:hypothetical protein
VGFCIFGKLFEIEKNMKSNILIFGLLIGPFIGYAQSYGDYAVNVIVAGNGFAHSSIVYFDDESWDPLEDPAYGFDPCCDALLVMGNANQPHIFTQVVAPPASPNNHRLSINGLPHLFESIDVPFGFLPGTLAQYTFTFKELYTMPQGVTVELEDIAQNVTQDLLLDSTYATWGAPSDNEARFVLHFNPGNVTGVTSFRDGLHNVRIVNVSGNHSIVGLSSLPNSTFRIFDLMGSVVWKGRNGNKTELSVNSSELVRGIYILEVTTEKGGRKAIKVNL